MAPGPLSGITDRRLHLGVGGTVLHPATGAPRRRRNPDRKRHASVCHAAASAVARGQTGRPQRSGYYNQYNQGKRSLALNFSKPGALEIARRLIASSDVVVNNFAARRDGSAGIGLRTSQSPQAGRHHDLALRLWRYRALQRLCRVRPGAGAAFRAVGADRLPGRAADACRVQLRGPQCRCAWRFRRLDRLVSSRHHWRRPIYRYEPVGMRDGCAARRPLAIHDERTGAGADRQPRSLDGAAWDFQVPGPAGKSPGLYDGSVCRDRRR